ncbi:larval cuticle protein 1-like isoform X2 [Frankliniella occidentalis]|uniref:Larval cuticle protein 1-like isoform X2 n=1 Tax=Frankliniella occidentalis TaxID=133901 RepID=A0A6J1RSD0_FRAOC|nr:larval cuticle protein 1-like isoform X2 [Frankliniella occidentalis]
MLVLTAAVLLALVLAAEAVPVPASPAASGKNGGVRRADRDVTVSKYSNKPNSGSGEYSYGFELSDGSSRYEEGRLQNAGVPGKEFLVVRGSFSRPRFDGTMEQVMYYADEGGFHVAKMVPTLGQAPASALVASLVG